MRFLGCSCRKKLQEQQTKADPYGMTNKKNRQQQQSRFSSTFGEGRQKHFGRCRGALFPAAYSLPLGFPATIERDARGRVAQLDRASAF
jgi:hypothetical protein